MGGAKKNDYGPHINSILIQTYVTSLNPIDHINSILIQTYITSLNSIDPEVETRFSSGVPYKHLAAALKLHHLESLTPRCQGQQNAEE